MSDTGTSSSKITFYFDEMVRRSVARELMNQGYSVVMAVDVMMEDKDDDTEHLPYATEHGMVMVRLDRPFAGRTMSRTDHAGLICWTIPLQDTGAMVRVLSTFADTHTPEAVAGQVFWLKP